jgi:hypothetical protein
MNSQNSTSNPTLPIHQIYTLDSSLSSNSSHNEVLLKHASTTWDVPTSLRSEFHKYYLLHWTGDYFQKLYYSQGAMIEHQGSKYCILWYGGDCRPVLAANRVAISFRKLNQSDPFGFALVRAFNMEIL